MRRTGTTRRGAFTATGAIAMGAVLAGCGDGTGPQEGSARADAATTAEQAAARAEKTLRTGAAGTSRELLARYEQVVRAYPATAAGLSPLRDAVRAHAKALAPDGGKTLVFSRTRATDAAGALKELAAAERRTADAHTATLLNAPPELARLLASIAAAGAAHAYLLTELAKETSS
ncbi:hypothetical protein GCM10010207_73950 [Streptomyces atratus]|uniref:hypothetical protein n=1 Tax=Streptomyces atratus TaxID=1893 RepID=UPI0016705DF0|nr:hypothetical protein [Streptomyces atratus]GGT63912.1 hypothetical protein GCM10010207_73950 [Streptomyces atratus]